jgi:hypothetical protein
MTKQTTYYVAGGLALLGLGYWWYTSHQTAAAAIVSQPAVPASVLPVAQSGMAQVVTPVLPVGTVTTPSGQDQTQLNALLAWTGQTKNPPLYAAMINALTPAQLSSLYNILTTDWQGSGQPTVAQTAFWNGLVSQYPFLKAPNPALCTSFTC